MRILRLSASLALLCAAGLAAADGGLKVSATGGFWSDLQTKLRFSVACGRQRAALVGYPAMPAAQDSAPLGASLGGDYYFSKDLAAGGRPPSGFRASGALLIRQPGVSLSDLAWQSRAHHQPGRAAARWSSPGNAGHQRHALPGHRLQRLFAEDWLGLLGRHRPGGAEPGQRARHGPRVVGIAERRRPGARAAHVAACCNWASTTRSERRSRPRGSPGTALCRINRV